MLTPLGISTTASNSDITITPHGTGDIVLDGQKWPQADGSANQYLKTDGAGTISFASISSGATGGGTDAVFVQNSQAVTTDYTVPSGKSASSTGPITLNAGVDITLSAGSRWVIL